MINASPLTFDCLTPYKIWSGSLESRPGKSHVFLVSEDLPKDSCVYCVLFKQEVIKHITWCHTLYSDALWAFEQSWLATSLKGVIPKTQNRCSQWLISDVPFTQLFLPLLCIYTLITMICLRHDIGSSSANLTLLFGLFYGFSEIPSPLV